MRTALRPVFLLILAAAPLAALSNDNASATLPASAQAAEQAVQPAAAATGARLEAGKVPRLAIRWACGDCPVNEKVAPLIAVAYAQEAAAQGQTVSDTEVAEVVIDDFRQRHPAARATLGLFAGKDRLGVLINFRGKMIRAHDYSANAIYGMNALCESVGKQAHQQINALLKAAAQ